MCVNAEDEGDLLDLLLNDIEELSADYHIKLEEMSQLVKEIQKVFNKREFLFGKLDYYYPPKLGETWYLAEDGRPKLGKFVKAKDNED